MGYITSGMGRFMRIVLSDELRRIATLVRVARNLPEANLSQLDAGNVRLELIDKTAADLKQKGVVFIKEPVDRGAGLKIAFFDGHDGVNLQLYEQKDEPPQA